MTSAKFRPLKFGVTRVELRDGPTGTHYLKAEQALQDFPERMTDRLRHWAEQTPERTLFARRVKQADGSFGDWRHISYQEAWSTARNIAQGLIDRGLNAERPVAILSENSLEHALLALGCMLAGVPFVPTSPPYSLVSVDYDKLKHVLKTVTPGLVFAQDERYAKAIAATVSEDVEVVMHSGNVADRNTTAFAQLCAVPATDKGIRLLCSHQLRDRFPLIDDVVRPALVVEVSGVEGHTHVMINRRGEIGRRHRPFGDLRAVFGARADDFGHDGHPAVSGYIARDPAPVPRGGTIKWHFVRDNGAEAPRVRRDGSPVTQDLGQEQMWRALRMLRGDINALGTADGLREFRQEFGRASTDARVGNAVQVQAGALRRRAPRRGRRTR